MDPLRATGLPRKRGVAWRPIRGLGTGFPLHEPNGSTVGHIDGR